MTPLEALNVVIESISDLEVVEEELNTIKSGLENNNTDDFKVKYEELREKYIKRFRGEPGKEEIIDKKEEKEETGETGETDSDKKMSDLVD